MDNTGRARSAGAKGAAGHPNTEGRLKQGRREAGISRSHLLARSKRASNATEATPPPMSSLVKSADPASAEVTLEVTEIAVAPSGADGGSDGGSSGHASQLTGHRSILNKSVPQNESFLEVPSSTRVPFTQYVLSTQVVPTTQKCSVRVGAAHDSRQ